MDEMQLRGIKPNALRLLKRLLLEECTGVVRNAIARHAQCNKNRFLSELFFSLPSDPLFYHAGASDVSAGKAAHRAAAQAMHRWLAIACPVAIFLRRTSLCSAKNFFTKKNERDEITRIEIFRVFREGANSSQAMRIDTRMTSRRKIRR